MRLVTKTNGTLVTSVDCYKCSSSLYNRSLSNTSANSSLPTPDDMLPFGHTVRDTVCVNNKANPSTPCVPDFDFFEITNETKSRYNISGSEGVLGLAPDKDDNGPSFLSKLYELKMISYLSIGLSI